MFGLIGWSIAGPTVLGTLAGLWLDKHHTGSHSWTLALLVAGLCLGSLSAWHWVAKEYRQIHAGEQDE
jgi:ATP synthase protein I